MRNVSTYTSSTDAELREELVLVTSALTAEYETLGVYLSDYHRDYLRDYAQSPGNSATAKNREAQYANMEMGAETILIRSRINSLILARDLLVFLLISRKPSPVPFPDTLDDDGLPVF